MAHDDGGAGLDDLERWAAEARAREAAEARVRERWLRTQAEESGRLGLVLAGMAERRAQVVVTTLGGRAVGGRLTAVGQDFVAVETAGTRSGTHAAPPTHAAGQSGRSGHAGRITLIALHAVAWVREAPGEPGRGTAPAMGPDEELDGPDDDDRPVPREGLGPAASLAGVLAQAVAHRPRVSVQSDRASVTGELRTVGVDVLVLGIPGQPPGLAYLRLRSIYEISFLDSG